MKILMLTPYLPFPLWSGGQIRSYNLIKHLSRKHQITLFSFIRDSREKQYICQLEKFCSQVKVFPKRPPFSLSSLTLSAVSFYPLVVCMYLNRSFKKEIEHVLKTDKFDLIHAETFYVMPNIPKNNIPTILAEQTIEYLVYQHHTETISFFPLKLLMKWDVLKIKHWEKKYWSKATKVIVMSEADRKVMQVSSSLSFDLVPNGVDIDFFLLKRKNGPSRKKTVLFVGNFKWLQNREAVSILVTRVWPHVKEKIKDAKLWIVGKFPTPQILSYETDNIRVSANVSDIREAYRKSDVMLAPIYGPGGTRYKILEAMASGIPVVTTSTGIEGLEAYDGRELLIRDKPKELVRATVQLLTDKKLYRRLVKNGRLLIEKKYNWEKIAKTLDSIYKQAVYEKEGKY